MDAPRQGGAAGASRDRQALVCLAFAPEHRRGHGALYGGLNQGRIDIGRLRRALVGSPLPRAADGRLVLALDVSPLAEAGRRACRPAARRNEHTSDRTHPSGQSEGACGAVRRTLSRPAVCSPAAPAPP
ncbi:transposase [Streptomyces sp. NPDC006326]|uniref:transposase n=1 Tax=Streptomyces sp. NPDC006326 TaxID=3156752 RepID=UPI0033BA1CDB